LRIFKKYLIYFVMGQYYENIWKTKESGEPLTSRRNQILVDPQISTRVHARQAIPASITRINVIQRKERSIFFEQFDSNPSTKSYVKMYCTLLLEQMRI